MRAPAAIALVGLSFATRTAAAEPCAPRAELSGDGEAMARVRDELGRIGVATSGPRAEHAGRACRTVRAQVQPGARGGLSVAIVDRGGRRDRREVSDAALAAVWIDSWLHDDLDGGLAAGSAPSPPRVASAALGPPGEVAVDTERPVAGPPRPIVERGGLGAGYEQTFTHSTSWQGFSAQGCVAVRGVCVGARVRYAHAPADAAGDTRSALAALATVSTAWTIGRMAIVPELGLGANRFAEQRDASCKPGADPGTGATCNVSDASCPPVCVDPSGAPIGPVVRSIESYQPQAAAALRIAVPLFEHVWLDAVASYAYMPFAHGDPFVADAKTSIAPALYTLPGEPVTSFVLGVGLRVGLP